MAGIAITTEDGLCHHCIATPGPSCKYHAMGCVISSDAKVRSPLYYSGLLLAGPAGARMSERLIYLFIKICFRYSYFYFISKDSELILLRKILFNNN